MSLLTERAFWISVRRGVMSLWKLYQLKPNPSPLDMAWIGALTSWTESIQRRWLDENEVMVEREVR